MGSIGFLKKFFSRVDINLHETNKQPKRVFTPRPHRIQLLSLHHVQFICKNPLIEDPIPLLNLSTNGAGLMKNAISTLPAPGTLLQGDFDFNGERHPIEMRLIHNSGQVAGCAFQGDFSQIRDRIVRYFDLELSALKMTQVKPEMLQTEADGTPHWFLGTNNCELYLVSKEERVIRFNLSFFANYIEGGETIPTRFGQVVEDTRIDKPKAKGSALVLWEKALPEDLLNTACRFMENVLPLSSAHRIAILEKIKKSSPPNA